ncbi:glycosyltransferase family 4 protein [Glycocaulis abyssi]
MAERRTRVLIQMNQLAAYRVPVFNLLTEHVDLDVAFVDELGTIENVRFNTIRGSSVKLGPTLYNRFPLKIANYDIIITGFDGRNLNSYYYTMLYPKKTIIFTQGYGASLIAAVLRRSLHNRAVATLVYTQANAQQLIRTGAIGAKVFFTGNTVKVGGAPQRGRRTFLNLGTPRTLKRVDDVLRAVALIKDQLPDHIRLTLAGPGAEAAYAPVAQQLGLSDKVEFHGEIRDEAAIAELFAEAIAFVTGHVGLSAPQALGHGVPIVARADISQAPEYECLIDGYTGRTYRSIDELAQILLELATQPDKAEELGRTGLALYKKTLTAEAMRDRILEAINYALSHGPHKRADREHGTP